MIRYALRCAQGHQFDSWFQSAQAHDRLAASGQLTCGVCGGGGVTKALMAPSVAGVEPGASVASEAPAPALSAPAHPLEAALRALRAQVEANAENVGRDFARKARAMHEGEAESRPIWGEATPAEARSLVEDGVPVAPLPFLGRRDD